MAVEVVPGDGSAPGREPRPAHAVGGLLLPGERLLEEADGRVAAADPASPDGRARVVVTDRRIVVVTWWAHGRVELDEFARDEVTAAFEASPSGVGALTLGDADKELRVGFVPAAELELLEAACRSGTAPPTEGDRFPAGRPEADELPFEMGQILEQAFARDSSRLEGALFSGAERLPSPAEGPAGPADEAGPRLLGVALSAPEPGRVAAGVSLEWRGRRLHGRGTGRGGSGRHRAVVLAALDALRGVLPGAGLESVTVAAGRGGREIVTAVLVWDGEPAAGTAAAGPGGADRAGALAVLDAARGLLAQASSG